MDLKHTVYAHIVPNGKIYIGITKQKVARRWRKGTGYKHNDYFNNVINKYGWDNIEHCVIASGVSLDEANNFEKILIDKLQTNNREFGYNLTDGGDGVNGTKCPEWKKDRQRVTMKGEGNPMYGVSLEGKSGQDNPMYGKPAINRRKVECITTGKRFDSVRCGATFYNTHSGDISKVAKGKRNYAGTLNGQPLVWRYVDEY